MIDSCIRSLNSRIAIVRQQEKRAERKRRREMKARRKQERLDYHLQRKATSEICHDSG